jgi:hypothetical protein
MSNFKAIITIIAILFTSIVQAQELSVNDKIVKVEELPEYIVISCDNISSFLAKTIQISIQARNSEYETVLNKLENILEDEKNLAIRNQTDLLNTMSKLGFDYVNAFPQNSNESGNFSRSSIVFRKKEKYRN